MSVSLETAAHWLRCANPLCGFLAAGDYFEEKTRFTPGVCPRCSGRVVVVAPFTQDPVPGASLNFKTRQVEVVA